MFIKEHPVVTIVIPSYNPGPDLLLSVNSALKQTYPYIEVIVVDDGSTDNSLSLLNDISDTRLRVVRQSNSGKSVAMNHAISLMSGQYLMMQDADDLSYPERVESLLEVLYNRPDIGMIFSGYDFVMDNKTLAPTFSGLNEIECKHYIEQFKMPGHDPTMMVRSDIAREMLFNPDLRVAQGFDFILRVGEKYPILRVAKCLYSYRITFSSATRNNMLRRRHFVRRVIREAHNRRGKQVPEFFSERFDNELPQKPTNSMVDNNIAAHFIDSVVDLKTAGKLYQAFKVGTECLKLHPLDFQYQKAFIYALLPCFLIHSIRSRKKA